jgi:hypothetical protein
VSEPLASPLASWESFYVILGSSAAALTGLQFVVIAFITENRERPTSETIDAFGTPTIVHFCAALLISAIMSAPWPSMSMVALAAGVSGAAGVVYEIVVALRARRQSVYQPVLEDWLWHVILPVLAYSMLLLGGLVLLRDITSALFMIAATTMLLLFIGIHNAWDTVTYIATDQAGAAGATARQEPERADAREQSARKESAAD